MESIVKIVLLCAVTWFVLRVVWYLLGIIFPVILLLNALLGLLLRLALTAVLVLVCFTLLRKQ